MTARSHHDHQVRRITQLMSELTDNSDMLAQLRQLIGDGNLNDALETNGGARKLLNLARQQVRETE